jgi:hypothetical protein
MGVRKLAEWFIDVYFMDPKIQKKMFFLGVAHGSPMT